MEKLYIRFKSPITVIMLMILIGGAWAYSTMKTSMFPDVTFPKIKVIADNGEQPVSKMMVTVTKPLENAIKRVENLRLVRSTTSMGSCEISAYMNWGSNLDLDKQQVESRIAQIKNTLPAGVNISVEKMNPSILPVIDYSLQSDTKNQIELKTIAEYTVKPFLSRVQGVSAVDVMGGKTKEYHIILNQNKLENLKISPQDVENAFKQTDFIKSNGYTIDYRRLYLTVTDATLKTKKQLENLVLFNHSGRIVRVSDIAQVKVAAETEYIKIKADYKDVPLVAVLKQPGSNLIDVSTRVTAQVKQLNKILPKGVKLVPYYNQAEFVKSSIQSIIDVLWIGLLLAIVVAIIFLRSAKASSVILVTIPLTLSLTLLVLKSIGFDFNIMTIGAIAASIGLIIDDAIIVVEQIHRTHEQFPHRKPKDLIGKSIQYLFPAMVSSSLSTIVILIPFELMSGVAGAYFKILTETMIVTLVCSFLITWIGLPTVYLLFSKDKAKSKEVIHYQPKSYKWMSFFVNRPYLSFGIIGILILAIYISTPLLKTGFLPLMDEGAIVLDYNSPPGTSLKETNRMLNEVDHILETTPEVKAYSRRTGTQMGFFITEPNRGDYLIELHNHRHKTTDQVSDEIRKRIEHTIPTLTVDFGQVIEDMLGDLMASAQPIEIKIFGDDHSQLMALSKQVADSVNTVRGAADVFDGITIAGPMWKVIPKEDKLEQFGMTAAGLQAQIQTHMEGTIIGSIPEKEQLTNIRMIFPKSNTTPIDQLKHMMIFTPSGMCLPLSEFANFSMQSGVTEIDRENLQTMGVVSARLNNRDLGGVMKDIKNKLKKITLPPSSQIVYGGSYAQQQKSFSELLRILMLAGLLVFTVVLFMFKSLKYSIIVLLISVLGISGSVVALLLTNTPLNVGSYTGLIMIIGIIGENSIFTIQQFLAELKNSKTTGDALVKALSVRLRPNLMTALGAIAALFPLALGIGTGAQMHQPLAIAVIGGFIIALPLLLIVLPGILKIILKNPKPIKVD